MTVADAVDRDGDLEVSIKVRDGDDTLFWLTREEQDRLFEVLQRVRLNRQTV